MPDALWRLYMRNVPDGGSPSAWSSVDKLLDLTADGNWNVVAGDLDLGDVGMTSAEAVQVELARIGGDASDVFADTVLVKAATFQFSACAAIGPTPTATPTATPTPTPTVPATPTATPTQVACPTLCDACFSSFDVVIASTTGLCLGLEIEKLAVSVNIVKDLGLPCYWHGVYDYGDGYTVEVSVLCGPFGEPLGDTWNSETALAWDDEAVRIWDLLDYSWQFRASLFQNGALVAYTSGLRGLSACPPEGVWTLDQGQGIACGFQATLTGVP